MLGFSKANRLPGPRSGVSSVSAVVHLRMSGFFAVDFGLRVAEMRAGSLGLAITAWRRDVACREEGARRREGRGAGEGERGKGRGRTGGGNGRFKWEKRVIFRGIQGKTKGASMWMRHRAPPFALIRPQLPSLSRPPLLSKTLSSVFSFEVPSRKIYENPVF